MVQYPSLELSEDTISTLVDEYSTGNHLMGIGAMGEYMPAGGASDTIAPLSKWTAMFLISKDDRVKGVTLECMVASRLFRRRMQSSS